MTRAIPAWATALQRRLARGTVSCTFKLRYEKEVVARRAGQTSLQSGRLPGRSRLFVYACCRCRGWHLSRSYNNRAAVTAEQLWEGVS